jgi:hypothetical protein
LGAQRILHFVSAAKNTVAFFKISLSSFTRVCSSLSRRSSSRSLVKRPLPRKA